METPIDLVPLKAKPMKIDVALSNSFGFGGDQRGARAQAAVVRPAS